MRGFDGGNLLMAAMGEVLPLTREHTAMSLDMMMDEDEDDGDGDGDESQLHGSVEHSTQNGCTIRRLRC